MANFERAQKIIDVAINRAERLAPNNWSIPSRLDEIRLYTDYAEPGYPNGPVALGNWNDMLNYDEKADGPRDPRLLPNKVGQLLEQLGFDLDWSDQYTECCECCLPVRTQADCYSWTQSYLLLNDCEPVCFDCLTDSMIVEYLAEIEGGCNSAIPPGFDPEDFSYHRLNLDFQDGWYGTNHDPRKIGQALENLGFNRFLFKIDGVGQFSCDFSVYVHEENLKPDIDKTLDLLENFLSKEDIDGPDIAKQFQKAMSNIPHDPEPQKEGVKYVSIDLDKGKATTYKVSPQDFIEGNLPKKE